jgi:hypothetical protein
MESITRTKTAKTTTKELSEQLFGCHLFLKSTSPCKPTTTKWACTSSTSCCGWIESRIWISSELIELLLLIWITQHLERFADHLEGIVGAIVPVLVRVGEQRQLSVCFLDVAIGTCRLFRLEAQNLVVCRWRAPFYPYYCGFLFDCEGAARAAVVVRAVLCVSVWLRLRAA